MCADLEARLRRALTDPPVPEGLPRRLRAGARAAVAVPRPRRGLRRLGRGAVAVAGAAAILAAGVVLALLVVSTPSHDPAAGVGGTGVEYRITPRSYDGVAPPAPPDAVADVLRRRATESGIDGADIRTEGDDVVMLMPGTHDAAWGTSLLQDLDLAIYDDGRSVVAAGAELAPVVAAAAAGGGAPTAHYAVGPPEPSEGAPAFVAGPYVHVGEAETRAAELRGGVWPQATAVAVHGGAHLVQNWPGGATGATDLAALRDPVVRPGQILSVVAEGRMLSIRVAPEAREAVGTRLDAEGAGQRLFAVAGASVLPGLSFVGYDAATGALTFSGTPSEVAQYATRPGPGVDALLDVAVRPLGSAPERGGVAVVEPPAGFDALLTPEHRPRPGSTRRILRGSLPGGTVTVWSWIGAGGEEVLGATGDTFGPVVADCPRPPDLGRPLPCVGGGGRVGHWVTLGRVRADAAGLEAVYADGAPVVGLAHDGFFAIELPERRGRPVRIEVTDAAGDVVEVADAGSPPTALPLWPSG